MDQCRHGKRWLTADPLLACPSARRQVGNLTQDFFVFEPALAQLAVSQPAVAVVPMRWYTIRGRDGLFADVQRLHYSESSRVYYIDSTQYIVPLASFTRTYPEIVASYSRYQNQFPIMPTKIECSLLLLLKMNHIQAEFTLTVCRPGGRFKSSYLLASSTGE